MLKNLVKIEFKIYHIVNGVRIDGAHNNIWGDVSGIEGNVASCEITEEERKRGIDIKELIKD